MTKRRNGGVSFILQAVGIGTSYKAGMDAAKASTNAGQAALVSGLAIAKQHETNATREVAVGTYNADIINQRAKQILSSQRAAAAAGGGDTTDETAQVIMGETVGRGSIEAAMQMANAEDNAAMERYRGSIARYTGATGLAAGRAAASAQKFATTSKAILSTGELIASSWGSMFGQAPTSDVASAGPTSAGSGRSGLGGLTVSRWR